MSVKAGERNVPDTPRNRQLNAVWYARELALYTIKICDNENVFLPKHRQSLTDDIVRTATAIYLNSWTANNIRVTEKNKKEMWSWRSRLQRQAILDCSKLLALIGLAHPLFHLKGKRVEYWSDQVVKVRNYIKKWRESDIERYS